MGDLMENINLMLLALLRQCAHLQFHRQQRFRGQSRILILLEERGKMSLKELSEILKRRPATLSEQLDGMEKNGFILRKTSAADRRNLDILLTPEGYEAAGEARRERQKTADALFGVLDGQEKEQLEGLLQKLLDEWQKGADES